ncbi:DNA polymerase phi-domain-containing protein [Phanerochaete sordida]|uniref:DNA polymerase phi-domain-containing protein n=1 Tax=Phanerochaete sordida TaxID=48140 RepID=A0A9P3LK38_9APHY|nr:DNA polymerase phi-domain-containing protein [Phanerochaete sordida]
MSTTLPLFWHLSSASKKERIDASVKLVSALEHFQAQFTPKEPSEATSEDEDEREAGDAASAKGDGLDVLNAQDVSYSIRRLIRGLASPRESSRLGFAVALTELLARINTVTCSQIVTLILDSAKTQGSMTGQEERDVLFARLFGLTAVVQSGLLVRDTPVPTSASSQPAASNSANFSEVVAELLALGEKKSWLRESVWWTIGLAVDALGQSNAAWRKDAFDATIQAIFVENKAWSPEKIALTLKLQKHCPDREWAKLLGSSFKQPRVVHTSNYNTLARILKDLQVDEDDDADGSKAKASHWKPQVHFVWDMLLDEVLSSDSTQSTEKSFPEFFRILVDESLFSAAASPERKYWGFQIFQKALPRVASADLPLLFTKNFMRSWINHLSNSDRYLHKIAKQVANDIQNAVKSNPTVGFTLILQLTGVHGSQQFDKLTKTKTVETILTNMNNDGIQSYIEYLLKQVNDEQGSKATDIQALNARRAWIVDQLAALIRNGAIPKDDQWVQTILDWFTVHGLFAIKKKSEKSKFAALREPPSPVFSDSLRKACRERLLSSLADLTAHATVIKTDDKTAKVAAAASDGQFWVSKVLSTIEQLEKDTKHATLLSEIDEDEQGIREKARELAERLHKLSEKDDAAKGAELLLAATLLHQYCADDAEEGDMEALESCIDAASRMFPAETKKPKKARKSAAAEGADDDAPEPVDVLVDTVIGFLEKATAYMRAVANQVFALLAGAVKESTVDLILAQLERKNPAELAEEDEEMSEDEEDEDEKEEDEEESEADDDVEEDEEDLDEAADPELRRKIEEALSVNGIQGATGESDDESEEELMDDDQMMAIDEQLAAVFRARADERKLTKGVDAQREATHYKNRVLDLLDAFLRRQPNSPLVVRLILPLIELVVSSGADEKQLAEKATGILRSRIGKSKDVPAEVDVEQATEVLKEIHLRARKAATGDILTTLSSCSLFVTKCLLHANATDAVLDAYRESLTDFATRKASRLNTGFLQDFVRRYAEAAWGLRDDMLASATGAVNGYRQVQVLQLVQTLFAQRPASDFDVGEALTFTRALRTAMIAAVRDACAEEKLTAPQVKELLKLALAGVRHTKRIAPDAATVKATWDAAAWEDLAGKLAEAERFKASTGLQATCRQIAQLINKEEGAGAKGKSKKRKADAIDVEGNGEKDAVDDAGAEDAKDVEMKDEAEKVEKPKRKKQKARKSIA